MCQTMSINTLNIKPYVCLNHKQSRKQYEALNNKDYTHKHYILCVWDVYVQMGLGREQSE